MSACRLCVSPRRHSLQWPCTLFNIGCPMMANIWCWNVSPRDLASKAITTTSLDHRGQDAEHIPLLKGEEPVPVGWSIRDVLCHHNHISARVHLLAALPPSQSSSLTPDTDTQDQKHPTRLPRWDDQLRAKKPHPIASPSPPPTRITGYFWTVSQCRAQAGRQSRLWSKVLPAEGRQSLRRIQSAGKEGRQKGDSQTFFGRLLVTFFSYLVTSW